MDTINPENGKKSTKAFITVFAGQSISLAGSMIVQFALVWWLTVRTNSSIVLAMTTLAVIGPLVIFGPLAGVVSDRFSLRKVVILTDSAQALMALVMALVTTNPNNSVGVLVLLLLGRGIAQAFQMPAQTILSTVMLEEENYGRFNAGQTLVSSLLSLSSPVIASLMIQVLPLPSIILVDVVSFFPGVIIMALVPLPHRTKEPKRTEVQTFTSDFKEAIDYLKGSRLILIIALFAIVNLLLSPLFTLLPLYLVQVHHGSVADYAVVEFSFQVGILLGSVFLVVYKLKSTSKNITLASLLMLALFASVISIVPVGFFLGLALVMVLVGLLISITDVTFLTFLQRTIPQRIQGRVFSLVFSSVKSILPLGLIGAGFLAESVGLPALYLTLPLLAFSVLLATIGASKIIPVFWNKTRKVLQQNAFDDKVEITLLRLTKTQ